MKITSIKKAALKKLKEWTDENLNEETLNESIEKFLEERKTDLMIAALGFEMDTWSRTLKNLSHNCFMADKIKEKSEEAVDVWLEDSGVIFKEIELSKAQHNTIIKAYKERLLDGLISRAKHQAEEDVKAIYEDVLSEAISSVSDDFKEGNIDIRQSSRW